MMSPAATSQVLPVSPSERIMTALQYPSSKEPVSPVDPLVESKGAELGFKTVWLDSWNASLALWYLELDSELLFVGDAGGCRRRTGLSGGGGRY